MKVADEPVLVELANAYVAGSLQADDGVERPVGEVERPCVAPHDLYPVRHAALLDQPPSLAHLLAADVDTGDLAAVALGDAQRWRPDAAARVKHALSRLEACHLPDQVGVGIERLRQRLAACGEVADMEVIAEEQKGDAGICAHLRNQRLRSSA